MLEQDSGGVRVSASVPDAASHKQNSVVRLGMRRDMVQPVWGAVTIIVDEVTRTAGLSDTSLQTLLGSWGSPPRVAKSLLSHRLIWSPLV